MRQHDCLLFALTFCCPHYSRTPDVCTWSCWFSTRGCIQKAEVRCREVRKSEIKESGILWVKRPLKIPHLLLLHPSIVLLVHCVASALNLLDRSWAPWELVSKSIHLWILSAWHTVCDARGVWKVPPFNDKWKAMHRGRKALTLTPTIGWRDKDWKDSMKTMILCFVGGRNNSKETKNHLVLQMLYFSASW